jgi:NADPH:quinone reductase-like Zn-dependent oxidoreductase
VRLYGFGGPEKLRYENNVPDPELDDGFVFVDAAATSVNPVDWKMLSGALQSYAPLELLGIIGRDVSGVVRGRKRHRLL